MSNQEKIDKVDELIKSLKEQLDEALQVKRDLVTTTIAPKIKIPIGCYCSIDIDQSNWVSCNHYRYNFCEIFSKRLTVNEVSKNIKCDECLELSKEAE